jgi:hypothetical protein
MAFPNKELAARALALELGAEDEFGLYELVWSLNAAYPESSPTEHVSAARAAIVKLLDEGRIDLLRAQWASAIPSQPLTLKESRALIESDVKGTTIG